MSAAVQKCGFGIFPRDFFEKRVENHVVNIVEAEFHYPRTDDIIIQTESFRNGNHRRKVTDYRQRKRYDNYIVYLLSYFAVQYATAAVQSVCNTAPPPAYSKELKNISSKNTVLNPPSYSLSVLKSLKTPT